MSAIKVGFGEADITPRGGAISLCGQWEERISDVILDPLMANAVVIESEGARSIWVACDLVFVSAPLSRAAKDLLRASLPGFEDEQLVLAATHVHTGPNTDSDPFLTLLDGRPDSPNALSTEECCRQIALGIERAVLEAYAHREPARFELAQSATITGVNRRTTHRDGKGVMYGNIHAPDFAGMEDRDGGPIQITYVRAESGGALRGVIAAVPCTAQVDESALYVTADYWHTARRVVKSALGADVGVVGLIRASGDLSPHDMIDRTPLARPLRGQEGAQIMGKRVGKAIISALDEVIAAYGPDAVHKHGCAREMLPIWPVDRDEYLWAKGYFAARVGGASGPLDEKMAYSTAAARIKRYESGVSEYPAHLYLTRIGDIVWISNPFELYIRYADRIRAACPEAHVIDVQLAGDDVLGYLPTRRAIEAGGYSTMIFSCLCDADGGEVLVEKSIGAIHGIMR